MITTPKGFFMKIKRTISIILLAFMLLTTLSSCVNLEPTAEDLKTVGKAIFNVEGVVNEFDVPYDSVRYFVKNYAATVADKYKGYKEDVALKEKYEKELRDYVSETVLRNYAIMKLCNDFGVDFNADAIQEKVEEYIDETIEECGSKKEYKKLLDDQYMTDRFYREYIALSYAVNELIYVFGDDLGLIPSEDEEIMDFLMSDEFIHTRHICVYKDGIDDEANRKKIELVYDKLINKQADFEQLIGEYSEDFQDTGKGYYFTRGEYDEVYEKASFDLRDEEYSGIVETSYGFYIIKRYAKLKSDKTYFEENLESLGDQIRYALTYNKVIEVQEMMSFEFNEYGASLFLSDIK